MPLRHARELVALCLAGGADRAHGLGERRQLRRIDRGERLKGAAGSHQLIGCVGAPGHAGVFHRHHAQTVTETVIARGNAPTALFLQCLVFRRVHALRAGTLCDSL